MNDFADLLENLLLTSSKKKKLSYYQIIFKNLKKGIKAGHF